MEDYMKKDERHRRMHVVAEGAEGAQFAALNYQWLTQVAGGELLEVQLETGRKHQIRVQMSARGRPLFGDRKYGSKRPFPLGIALHSRYLKFEHPVGNAPLEFTAPLPGSWDQFEIESRLTKSEG